MRSFLQAVPLAMTVVCACCTSERPEQPAAARDDSLAADIATLRHSRIFFGHQSVGLNILDGMARLTAGVNGAPAITMVHDSIPPSDAYVADAFIGENTDPRSKCAGFVRALDRFADSPPEVAMMKFCFVDFAAGMTAAEIFSLYTSTVDSLKRRYPALTIVHVTAPLTARKTGVKQLIKGIIGRDHFAVETAERHAYNGLLRRHFTGEPLFDIAEIESTRPDGTQETWSDGSTVLPVMVPAYTNDGGHLNEAGELRAARGLVRTLAGAIRTREGTRTPAD